MTLTTKYNAGQTIWVVGPAHTLNECRITGIKVHFKVCELEFHTFTQETQYECEDNNDTFTANESAEGKVWWKTHAEAVAAITKKLVPTTQSKKDTEMDELDRFLREPEPSRVTRSQPIKAVKFDEFYKNTEAAKDDEFIRKLDEFERFFTPGPAAKTGNELSQMADELFARRTHKP